MSQLRLIITIGLCILLLNGLNILILVFNLGENHTILKGSVLFYAIIEFLLSSYVYFKYKKMTNSENDDDEY